MNYCGNKPSLYETNALSEIKAFKYPQKSWIGKAADIVSWPIDKAGEAVMKIPGVEFVIEKAAVGALQCLNDFSCWSVRDQAIYDEYRKAGIQINETPHDLFNYDLERLDKVVSYLAAKYKALAAAEGAVTGSVGLPGIPADVIALVALSQRAIGEYAIYYGFDLSLQNERLYALNILGYASSPTDATKQAAMMQLVKIAKDVAAKKTWKHLQDYAFVQLIKKICESIGIRLTKAKLADILPGVGAVVGGGFNAYFIGKVCTTSHFLYRERFLAQKYGPDLIV